MLQTANNLAEKGASFLDQLITMDSNKEKPPVINQIMYVGLFILTFDALQKHRFTTLAALGTGITLSYIKKFKDDENMKHVSTLATKIGQLWQQCPKLKEAGFIGVLLLNRFTPWIGHLVVAHATGHVIGNAIIPTLEDETNETLL